MLLCVWSSLSQGEIIMLEITRNTSSEPRIRAFKSSKVKELEICKKKRKVNDSYALQQM